MAVFSVDALRFEDLDEATAQRRRQIIERIVSRTRPAQPDNGDFSYADKRGSFSKGLRHDPDTGLVDPNAFAMFAGILASPRETIFSQFNGFRRTFRGSDDNPRPWVNPVGGRAFSIAGGDPQQFAMPPAPAFGSDELTFEIAENYWMAALRDIPFSDYSSHPLAMQAADELTALHQAATAERFGACGSQKELAPTSAGQITPELLFRGLTPGDRTGPYISQFLLQPVPFGAQGYEQKNRTIKRGKDFMTTWSEWLNVQNGAGRDYESSDYDPDLHFLRNGRDLAYWVRVDVLFQAYFNACLIMLQGSDLAASVPGGIGAPSAVLNPYRMASDAAASLGRMPMQQGFGTLGGPGHIGMLCEVAALALKAVWFQKWYVHLRFRPEVYAARIERARQAPGSFNLPVALINSQAVQHAVAAQGNALLPMAFPEGSPMHPAYGAGHATVAGACVTILKALFDTTAAYPDPMHVSIVDGKDTLVDYAGAPLTIEGELNKLANNVSLGRNIAGVHWRSDGTYSLNLGEEVAIALLKTYAYSYSEVDAGTPVFQFTRFNGQPEVIRRGDFNS
ncbi:MAG: vanadium-dependent haloperoxidase [Cyanobium sp. CZS 48M]|nr:vanadium-dependent haloperoxidase [Cyanobium sp. CZS48M]